MGLLKGVKVSPVITARRLLLMCAVQRTPMCTMNICFHLPQYLISTHKEAMFYIVSFMQGENTFIVMVITGSVRFPL